MKKSVINIIIAVIVILAIFSIFYYVENIISLKSQKVYVINLLYNNTDISINCLYPYGYGYEISQIYSPDNVSIFYSPFMWNYRSAQGTVNLTYKAYKGLYVAINVTSFKKINPSIDVDGYPGIMYGQEYWFPFQGRTVESNLFNLPINVTKLPVIYSLLNYTIWDNYGVIDDFSYDIWLTTNPNTTNLQFPDIELMIWLYHQSNITSPYFIKEGELNVTIYVNGTRLVDTFIVYVLPHTGSSSGWIGVYFLSEKNLEGVVKIPLSLFIENEFEYIEKVFPQVSEQAYYLDAIQVGMEFNDINGSANLGYMLYSWYLYIYN